MSTQQTIISLTLPFIIAGFMACASCIKSILNQIHIDEDTKIFMHGFTMAVLLLTFVVALTGLITYHDLTKLGY